jgi:phosphopantothenoylcysteine decarboxylase
MAMLEGREIVLGVGGGIAAYKAAMLTSLLVQRGAGVTAVLTLNARRFVGAATFAALTGRPVAARSFDPAAFPLGAHIELAARADLVVVAPATADLLAKAATGAADDLLTTLLLCAECPVLMAPAMNSAMWAKAAVQRNVRQLAADGVAIVQPGTGWLSCRQTGAGRMAEPDEIATVIHDVLAGRPHRAGGARPNGRDTTAR